MNAAVFVTLVCALVHMTTAQQIDCTLVRLKCKGCAANEQAINVPGSCCPICRPTGGVVAQVCPLVCPGLLTTCVYDCPQEGCPGNQLCCSHGCGNICKAPVTVMVDSPIPGGLNTCQYDGKTYNVGDIFYSDAIAFDVCQECQCRNSGHVTCKPGN